MSSLQRPSGNANDKVPKDTLQNTITLLVTMADTTWRILIPAVICVGIGLWVDTQYQTKPWITLGGLCVSLGIAALLVRLQIKKVQRYPS